MAFETYPDIDDSVEEQEKKQRFEDFLVGGKKAPRVLGLGQSNGALQPPEPPAGDSFLQRPSAGLRLGEPISPLMTANRPAPQEPFGDVRPRIPSPRFSDAQAPALDSVRPSLFGGLNVPQPTRPTRPNVAPTREDFPAKPEVSGIKKYLGLGLAALAGPQAGPLAERILHGQRDEAERRYQQANQEWEQGLSDQAKQAQIDNIRSEIKAREDKPDPEVKPEAEVFKDLIRQGYTSRQAYEIMKQAGQKPPTPSFEQQEYQEWADAQKKAGKPFDRMTFEKEKSAATQRPERPEKPQRMLGLTPDNKVIEIQPGMALPPGTKSLGGELNLTTKTEQGEEAGKAATQYANDYLAGKQWTGPGDEALMEKFFEMAKPSSGFRMTQAQIEMLQRSRDLMGSLTAKAKHAFTPEAPWFSDTQRQQIVKTMNDLAKSRQEVKPGAAGGGGTGDVVRFSDGGRNFAIPSGQVSEFLKDHPNAQRR